MLNPLIGLSAVTILTLALTACGPAESTPEERSAPVIEHVHGIAQDPRSAEMLLATHNGIFQVAEDGTVTGPIGGFDFDAMGFTVLGDSLIASGHPGPKTPAELGAPNLGIIRSDDSGENWIPVALTNVEDFHVLTSGADGTLYGIGSSTPELLLSSDAGATWEPRSTVPAVGLALRGDSLFAATEQGLQVSVDQGATFSHVADAPLMYLIAVTSSGTLVGVGADGYVWSESSDGQWKQVGAVSGTAQALGVSTNDAPVVVDDRGVVRITSQDSTVLSPVRK